MRVYSNYEPNQYDAIEAAAKKIGLSPSAYQRYVTLLSLHMADTAPNNITTLIQQMHASIDALPSGTQFLVSTLLPADTWCQLSAGEKRTLGSQLSTYAKANPDQIVKETKKLAGSISHYRKL